VPRVVVEKLVGDSSIARDHEGFGERPQVEVEHIREMVLRLDEGDDDGDGDFPRKLPSDGEKENKMPKEKAVRWFGLGTREMIVSGKLKRDEQEAGTGTVHTRSWKRRRCAASFHSKLDAASISTEPRATTSFVGRNMIDLWR